MDTENGAGQGVPLCLCVPAAPLLSFNVFSGGREAYNLAAVNLLFILALEGELIQLSRSCLFIGLSRASLSP